VEQAVRTRVTVFRRVGEGSDADTVQDDQENALEGLVHG
jgi:hypothetical protein